MEFVSTGLTARYKDTKLILYCLLAGRGVESTSPGVAIQKVRFSLVAPLGERGQGRVGGCLGMAEAAMPCVSVLHDVCSQSSSPKEPFPIRSWRGCGAVGMALWCRPLCVISRIPGRTSSPPDDKPLPTCNPRSIYRSLPPSERSPEESARKRTRSAVSGTPSRAILASRAGRPASGAHPHHRAGDSF